MQRSRIALATLLSVSVILIAGCGGSGASEQKPATMPPDVTAEMQKRLGSTTGPGDAAKGGDASKGEAPKTGTPKPPTEK